MSRVTVITASMPGRHELLAQAAESLRDQTYGSVPWLVRIDEPDVMGSAHLARQRNILLEAVETEFVAVLDDDDLFDPTYLERVAEHFDDADLVYTYCRGFPHPHGPVDLERLKVENYIDAESVMRTDFVKFAGGWPENGEVEDWQLYRRLADMGARFHCIPEQLRSHRHGGWHTIGRSRGWAHA